MRRAWGAATISVVLAACPAGQLEGGRYACDPSGDRGANSAQCPGEWRCGLEGVCHATGDTRTAWRCETSADCEARFQCGLSRSREGRECHDPDAAVEWPCDLSADCSAGFQCGLSRERDAGECHDPSTPRDWRCESDSHCLGGWRCAAQGTCADPKLDALVATGPVTATATWVSPLQTAPYDRVTGSPVIVGSDGRSLQAIAAVRGAELEVLLVDAESRGIKSWAVSAPDIGALATPGTRSLSEFGSVTVTDERPRAYITTADGGTECLTFNSDGGYDRQLVIQSTSGLPLPYRVGHFKIGTGGSANDPPSLVAAADDPRFRMSRIWGPTRLANEIPTVNGASGAADFSVNPANRIRDFAAILAPAGHECMFVSDSRGLWVAQRDPSYGYEPVDSPLLPNAACAAGIDPGVNRIQSLGVDWLAVERVADAGVSTLSLLDVGTLVTRTGANTTFHCTSFSNRSCLPSDRFPVRVELGPCTPCPGSTLFDFAPVENPPGPPELEARCADADGGVSTFFRLAHRSPGSSTCEVRRVSGPSTLFSERGVRSPELPIPGGVIWTGGAGQIWFGAGSATSSGLVLDRAVSGVVAFGTTPGDFLAFTPDIVSSAVDGRGLVTGLTTRLHAAVRHQPGWVLRDGNILDVKGALAVQDARVVAVPASPMTSPLGYHSGAAVRSSMGTRVAVTISDSQLWAADLERWYAGDDPVAVLTPRLLLESPVGSLALPETAAPGGAWLDGYVVLIGHVQRLVAETPTRWRTEEVPLGPSLTPLEAWFDRGRGRVGLASGAVYALPSRVPVAPALPMGAIDYEQACTEQLVLSGDGLYRLTAEAGATVGAWQKLLLPAGFADTEGFDGARVHALGNAVYVFTRAGAVAKVTLGGASCP